MITSTAFAGKHYAVLGLARSGLATVAALLASGARLTAWDDDQGARDKLSFSPFGGEGQGEGDVVERPDSPSPSPLRGSSSPLKGRGLEIADFTSADLAQFDSIVVTPGLPLNRHPIARRAAEAGVEIIGDIELFARARPDLPPHKVVGITGTNGKSTTTALVHHILQTAGVPSLMGGNIGLPILAQDPLPEGGVYVLELSSYQLDLTLSLDCDVTVLLNITPDHLDRYESFDAYAASKARLLAMQSTGHLAFIDCDDPEARAVGDRVKASKADPRDVVFQTADDLWTFEDNIELSAEVRSRGKSWPALKGSHNASNAVAAINIATELGIDEEVIERGLRLFPGLPHRMELIRVKDGVKFVNDSKATNPTATAPALAAFPAIRWILGGRAKADDLDECAPHFGHVRSAYTIGEASGLFARLLGPHMPVAECGTLDAAVRAAAHDAREGDTVLLSPACASFDQFRDFEARGDAFRALVRAL